MDNQQKLRRAKPFEGLKVVELGGYVSATTTGRLLADMGAEVIKIERPEGDGWRYSGINACGGGVFSHDENPVFDLYNAGKKTIVLNYKLETGKRILMEMIGQADIFLTNLRPAALKRNGLDYETLHAAFPKLIYALCLGYGDKGPDANAAAFDTTAFWTRTGFIGDMVYSDAGIPMNTPWSVGDSVTGIILFSEINAALYNRTRTGCGELVKTSLYHAGIFTMASMQVMSQKPLKPFGSPELPQPAWAGAPTGVFQCKNGEWLKVQLIDSAKLAPKFFEVLGHPEWNEDERIGTAEARKKNKELLYQMVKDCIKEKDADELERLGKENDLGLVRVRHFRDISEDEQAWANHYVHNVTFRNGVTRVVATSPIEMESVGELCMEPAHHIGEDTESILRNMGYSDAQIKQLCEEGIVRKEQ